MIIVSLEEIVDLSVGLAQAKTDAPPRLSVVASTIIQQVIGIA